MDRKATRNMLVGLFCFWVLAIIGARLACGQELTAVNVDTKAVTDKSMVIFAAQEGGFVFVRVLTDKPMMTPVTVDSLTITADSEQTVLNLRTASTRYVLRNLRLKSADPGANTVTVYLYEFINDAFIAVDTFAITTLNYTSYFSLQDMFGEPQVYGDNLMLMIKSSAGGPYAVTGQYSYAKTNN